MGQKVNPNGFRIGVNKTWNSTWYADKKDFANFLVEDSKIRNYITSKYASCAISKVVIERTENRLTVNVYTAKPGMLIGVKGAEIDVIKKALAKTTGRSANTITLNIKEVKRPDNDAVLVAQGIAQQLEKRVSYKRAAKMAIQKVMKQGAKGVKVMVSGRLNGAEIANSEFYLEGSLPLHTLRADIDYGTAEAHTTFGVVGVKVWVYNGNIIKKPSTVKQEEVTSDVNA